MQIHSFLRGASFRPTECQQRVMTLADGEALELRRDPENKYDPNAVGVYVDNLHLGFVAKEDAVAVASFMDNGLEPTAKVFGFQNMKTPGLMIEFPDNEAA